MVFQNFISSIYRNKSMFVSCFKFYFVISGSIFHNYLGCGPGEVPDELKFMTKSF